MIDTVKRLMEPVPKWVLDGWYGNNPDRQQFAIARYRTPVVTDAERDAARAYAVRSETTATFACEECGRFAFPTPTICFWCTRCGR